MRFKHSLFITFFVITGLFLCAGISLAVNDDFEAANKVESEHFTLYYAQPLQLSDFDYKLNVSASDKILAGKTIKPRAPDGEFPDMLDTLFLEICNILDMQLYSYHGDIKVCHSQNQLKDIYKILFRKDLGNRLSFYVYDTNTIYISAGSFKREVLGHEIAHAIISHYFIVLPSVKIQEVLSSYVEFQLRKNTR